jgi:hypothetical protein
MESLLISLKIIRFPAIGYENKVMIRAFNERTLFQPSIAADHIL